MKILSVIGTRPQFIKAAAISSVLQRREAEEVIVNTGQHYDFNLSDIFIRELSITQPRYNLEVGSHTHGVQTGLMMQRLDEVLLRETPDCVLVYGDTNSTLAGALCASKLGLPVCHIEAGLRSGNRTMPEEINRIAADHVSDLLFAPSAAAMKLLSLEGITHGVYNTGDVMFDIYKKMCKHIPDEKPDSEFALMTLHRAENTSPAVLAMRLRQAASTGCNIIWPVHPRTRAIVEKENIAVPAAIETVEPMGWIAFQKKLRQASFVLTDSGGLQKEAFWQGKFCFTLRNETEWTELVEAGVNTLVPSNNKKIEMPADLSFSEPNPYGRGDAAEHILNIILSSIRKPAQA